MRYCAVPHCPNKVERGRCADHQRGQGEAQGWSTSHGQNVHRMRGRALQRARAALFAREPLCRICRAAGRVSAAVIRDHIVPLAEGGQDADYNVQPLCQTCSDAKTQRESARGRGI